VLEEVTRVLTLLAICSYVLGLITVNLYLSRIGVSDFSLLQTRYVSTGALVLAYLTVSCSYIVLYAWLFGGLDTNLILRIIGLVIITILPVLLFRPLFRRSREERRAQGGKSGFVTGLLSPFRTLLPMYALLGSAMLTGVMTFVLLILVRKEPLRMEGDLSLEFFPIRLLGFRPPAGIERWLWFAVATSGFILLFYIFLRVFIRYAYPLIPETFGGGKPRHARLLIAQEELDGLKELGIPIDKSNKRLSDVVSILFEGASTYALELSDGRRLQVDKTKIVGTLLAKDGENSSTLQSEGLWHSVNGVVYHNHPNCKRGNSIEAKNVRQGTGGKPLCGECARLNNASGVR
jgi:hypothetical protein